MLDIDQENFAEFMPLCQDLLNSTTFSNSAVFNYTKILISPEHVRHKLKNCALDFDLLQNIVHEKVEKEE